MWHRAHCQKGVNRVVKLTVSRCPNIYVGLQMIPASFLPGSESRIVNAPVDLDASASVALVQIGASMTAQARYWRFLLSSVLSSAEVGSSLLAWWYIGTFWKAILICPSLGTRVNMFSLKGQRMVSQYFYTRFTLGFPARVRVKLEERVDHQRPTRIVIGGLASPMACLRQVSMALTMEYALPLNGFWNSMVLVPGRQ